MSRMVWGRIPAWGCVILLLSGSVAAIAQDEPPAGGPPKDSPLFVQPTTIDGNFDAALLMLKLARPDLAKHYLDQLLALNPTEDDLLALRDKHGTGTFLELSAVKELSPTSVELLDRINQAVRSHVSHPGYLASVLKKLEGTARERAEALTELRHLGPYAVPGMLQELDRDQGVGRDTIASTLARLGSDAVPPLIGALTSPSENVRTVAAEVLGKIGSEADILWLWSPAFAAGSPAGTQRAAREAIARLMYGNPLYVSRLSSDGAAQKLLTTATQHLTGKYKWPELFDDQTAIPVWTWNPQAGSVVEHPVSRPQASLYFAERLAREAAALSPASEHAPVVLLATLLTRDMEQVGWQQAFPSGPGTVFDLAVRCGPETCERVLRYALDQKLVAAAVGSLEALALNGSTALLRGTSGKTAVVDALDAPETRIQFAAAVAILHWEPVESFRGSRRVIEILARALNAQPKAASVVIDPNVSRANATAGLFNELGFNASLASTGMDGFRIAAERGNIELAVLHPAVVRWELSQTLANLRADARTAGIPVVIYGPAAIHDRFDRLSAEFQNVVYLNEANNALEVNRDLRPMLAQVSPPPLTEMQRSEQITQAAFWLRQIANRNVGNVFDLVPAQPALAQAIADPRTARDALVALGAIGRPDVQEQLLEVALDQLLDSSIRELAAAELAFHIQRFGQLLKPERSQVIATAWKTETDPAVKTALAGVIGSLKPTLQAARNEILQSTMSLAPVGAAAPPKPGLP